VPGPSALQFAHQVKPRIEDFKNLPGSSPCDTEYLHPKDGVFPEKVNEGRLHGGFKSRFRIGDNPKPIHDSVHRLATPSTPERQAGPENLKPLTIRKGGAGAPFFLPGPSP